MMELLQAACVAYTLTINISEDFLTPAAAQAASRLFRAAMIMSDKTKSEQAASPTDSQQEAVPEWLSNRLRRMFTEVMDEPVPDEFKALLRQLEDKERGS